jgi:signal peptidase I
MVASERIRQFFFPRLTRKFFLRLAIVAVCSYILFAHVLTPVHIDGISMEPTYHDGGYTFLFKLRYLFSKPERGDVVAVRIAGKRVMLLKRVVALEGERVEFRKGKLYINGKELREPYVRNPCYWNLSPRKVGPGSVYVVGDNRDMPMEGHQFGETSIKRIVGAPLW